MIIALPERRSPGYVKVRLNAWGKRVLGAVELPDGVERISDLLNSPSPCVHVFQGEPALRWQNGSDQVIFKEAINYLEAIEEPKLHTAATSTGNFIPIVGEMRGPDPQHLVAEMFVPYGETLFDVLNDPRMFISMRNVHFPDFVERYPFLAVNKKSLILVRS